MTEKTRERVLPFDEALSAVLAQARSFGLPGKRESLPLLEAAGRVLAQAIAAERDQPPFDRSTRDGYAVRAADIASGRALRVAGSIRAGERWQGQPLAAGEALEIMTGAPLPAGAEAVLMVEHTALEGDALRVAEGRTVRVGENVVPRGAEAREGDSLLPVGRVLGAAELAVAASCGCASLEVFARPVAAVISTGDELVELNTVPEPWQIRNSNSYALVSLVQTEGGEAHQLPIARDTLEDLRERIAQGRESDLLLLSGGVSMGKYDLVEQVLTESGAEFFFTGALIQPGKPVVFGRLPKGAASQQVSKSASQWTYFLGLPGNPVSTQVCFHLFAAPLLKALAGRSDLVPRFVEARLAEDVKGGARVTRFLPAELVSAWDGVTVRVIGWQGSGDVAANARGNCYAVLPVGAEVFRAGETVRVLLR
ncbi:molybdopterin molybdotransferase MoeA [Granulicella mallensis]|uniref:Molybdopterin molybdenumtransferase n=1 Tax=Granulicella mallensis (strain ATCC BAA-1857 / DSM 23137 / MP5ACTX8) TaxID=682795 RepID=G8NPF3_GRAMM|nr:gephyrin-like molybdotransferase Glp [Granulicella mallensis]AEU34873.1 molybdenum cofactor synthesis domain protein [Granulicella mallensis MP5ACTX8]